MCKTHLRVQQAERVDLCVCVLVKCWPHNYCDLLACACITTKKKNILCVVFATPQSTNNNRRCDFICKTSKFVIIINNKLLMMMIICACTRNQIMRIKWYGNRKWFSFSIWLWLCVLLMLCWDRAHTYRHEWIGMLYCMLYAIIAIESKLVFRSPCRQHTEHLRSACYGR